MAQTLFQRVTDLSRLNWKGWLLLLATIAVMFTAIVYGGMNIDGGGITDSRGGRKILGFVFAFFAFGGFILIAVGLRKIGVSIWKDGMDPYDEEDSGSSSRAPAVIARAAALLDTEPSDASPIDSAGELAGGAVLPDEVLDLPIDPTDLL